MNNIQKLIHTIQYLGYRVLLEGDKIKLKFIGKDDPPKEASTIINEVKQNKDMVIEYLRNISQMDEIFQQAVNKINEGYPDLTIRYISKTFPKLYKKALIDEDKINTLWNEGKDVKAFEKAVNEWRKTQMKFIKLFHAKKNIDDKKDKEYNPSNRKPDPCQGLGKEEKEHGTV
ncbi:MAG: hypothetical protein DWB56_04095 [Candidatus Jettenia sp.]|uniref:Uncharacterized protein n=1 Tax=Candidatus Jettenia caeni TaxID=247490 RepID=I3ILZ1_9BACT|nr:hypothetical protein [Candidatus Jettenia sp. AMX1]MBC6928141.1 hypothetical protein [Candidatus Jettenia sp.]NUN23660.1 hypothetical protein [Candidatus Jettenia caeni]KAA0249449.1 MAG: hypothetical protein EDM77_08630 [Candidatus Jettenia sp. AMX1]MCE7879233.1 hypothetical protein [Candidatus Jettenia sp. AMX1]MCQ3925950.1 hypothetical protein [Candidatus Jettenia sp.]